MKYKKMNYYHRSFLNKKDGLDAIETRLELGEHSPFLGGSINISDCSETVHLEFNAYSKSSLKEVEYKIEKLYDAVTKFRDKFYQNLDEMLEQFDIAEEIRKERKKEGKVKSIISDLSILSDD